MKKVICIILSIVFVLSLSACGQKNSNYYSETVFEELKTFTDISKTEPTATDKTFAAKTTYEYLLTETEKADEIITEYKNYLTGYGFSTVSDTEEEVKYISENKELVFSSTVTENGVQVNITLPCDEATINSRNDAIYLELETAFNNKDIEKITDLSNKLSGEYKNSKYYTDLARGMEYYESGLWAKAYALLSTYTDIPEAKACADEIASYNGVYKCTSKPGAILYILIRDGKVGKEIASKYDSSLYNYMDPVYYNDDLINRILPSGERQLMIGTHYSDHDVYSYAFLETSNGNFFAIRYETNKYDTFNGEYVKISETPPEKR